MPSVDMYGNFRGTFLGADRLATTTPSPDASDALVPFLPISYPAPWLPIRRRDESHPIAAGVVISEGQICGVDQSGALIPAGYFCGLQPNGATKNVTGVAVASDVATVLAVHAWKVGETVNFTGFIAPFLPLNGPQVLTAVTPGVSASFDVVDANESETVPTVGTVTGVSALGGEYSVIAYTQYDVGSVTNPQTGIAVQAAGEYVVLAAPADGAVGDRITLPNGTVITVAAPDLTFAAACTLIPGGTARALGFAVTNFFTYLGGIKILSSVGGISYLMLTQRPDLMQVTNYMHSMGGAIKTHFVLRVPWIGATPNTLATLAAANGVVGYTQTDFSRSFVHFTGAMGNAPGTFFLGCSIVPSNAGNGTDAGNYAPYNPNVNHADDIVGKVLGVELMYPIRDYADRVRTQFDRATEFVGPRMDPNPVTFQMGGSATKGLDFAISLGTNGLFQLAVKQNITALTGNPALSTYVIMHVNCR